MARGFLGGKFLGMSGFRTQYAGAREHFEFSVPINCIGALAAAAPSRARFVKKC